MTATVYQPTVRKPNRRPGAVNAADARAAAIAEYARDFASWGVTRGELQEAQLASVLLGLDTPVLGEIADAMAAQPALAASRGDCPHYFVKEGGRWVCTMCGASR